jgi:hypothetical protein
VKGKGLNGMDFTKSTETSETEKRDLKLLKFKQKHDVLPEEFIVIPAGSMVRIPMKMGPSKAGGVDCTVVMVKEIIFPDQESFLLPSDQFVRILEQIGSGLEEMDASQEENKNTEG